MKLAAIVLLMVLFQGLVCLSFLVGYSKGWERGLEAGKLECEVQGKESARIHGVMEGLRRGGALGFKAGASGIGCWEAYNKQQNECEVLPEWWSSE